MTEWLITLWMLFGPLAAYMFSLCCCVEGCAWFEDAFATDQIATEYTTSSGTFTVSGGTVSTTDASALITCDTALPASFTTARAVIEILCATTADIGRLVLAYVDDNTYWFAEVQPGATNGTLKLFQRSGGVNTQRGSTQTVNGYSANETVRVKLCIYNGRVHASAFHPAAGATASLVFTSAVTLTSTKGGFGTGAGSSSVTFDNFSLTKHRFEDSACLTCDTACAFCQSGTPSGLYQYDISGVVNRTCTNCSGTFNTTLIINNNGFCTPTTSHNCTGANESIQVEEVLFDGTDYNRRFSVVRVGGLGDAFEDSVSLGTVQPVDCSVQTTHNPVQIGAEIAQCDWSAATVIISSL